MINDTNHDNNFSQFLLKISFLFKQKKDPTFVESFLIILKFLLFMLLDDAVQLIFYLL